MITAFFCPFRVMSVGSFRDGNGHFLLPKGAFVFGKK